MGKIITKEQLEEIEQEQLGDVDAVDEAINEIVRHKLHQEFPGGVPYSEFVTWLNINHIPRSEHRFLWKRMIEEDLILEDKIQ